MANTPTIDGTEVKNGFGAYKLIQLLMILPYVLQQSGLNLRQIEDAIAGIKAAGLGLLKSVLKSKN